MSAREKSGADAAAEAETRRIASTREFYNYSGCEPRGTTREESLTGFRARQVERLRSAKQAMAAATRNIEWVDAELAALTRPPQQEQS